MLAKPAPHGVPARPLYLQRVKTFAARPIADCEAACRCKLQFPLQIAKVLAARRASGLGDAGLRPGRRDDRDLKVNSTKAAQCPRRGHDDVVSPSWASCLHDAVLCAERSAGAINGPSASPKRDADDQPAIVRKSQK
jgi:hypothetical protein